MKSLKIIAALFVAASLSACGTFGPAPITNAYTFQSTKSQHEAESDAFMCNGHPTNSKAAKCMLDRGYTLVKVVALDD